MAEKWVSVSEACQLMQVSERTLYRKIKDGKIESRMTGDSHREVLMAVPMTKEEIAEGHLRLASETVDNQLKIVATALGSTELVNKRMQTELDFVKTELDRVRENARAEIVRVQDHSNQQIEYIKTEVIRSRWFGLIGWGTCGVLTVLLLIVSIVMVNKLSSRETQIKVAFANADSAKQMATLLTDRMTDKEREIQRLEVDAARVTSELTDNRAKLAALTQQNIRAKEIENKIHSFKLMTDTPATMAAEVRLSETQPFELLTVTRPSSQPVSQPTSQSLEDPAR